MHKKQPIFQEAQRVSLRLQSAQSLFSGCFTSARSIRALASVSARDCVFLLAYDMVSTNRRGALDATPKWPSRDVRVRRWRSAG